MSARIPAVTTTSAITTPMIPNPAPMTSTTRRTSVDADRAIVSALNSRARFCMRRTWKGMNVNPIANVFSSTSCSARV